MKKKVKELLAGHPGGVKSNDFGREYQVKYGELPASTILHLDTHLGGMTACRMRALLMLCCSPAGKSYKEVFEALGYKKQGETFKAMGDLITVENEVVKLKGKK